VKNENYFENFGHKIGGMGYIKSDKANPMYVISSCYTKSGWTYLSQIRSA